MFWLGFFTFPTLMLITFFITMASLSKGLNGTYKWWRK